MTTPVHIQMQLALIDGNSNSLIILGAYGKPFSLSCTVKRNEIAYTSTICTYKLDRASSDSFLFSFRLSRYVLRRETVYVALQKIRFRRIHPRLIDGISMMRVLPGFTGIQLVNAVRNRSWHANCPFEIGRVITASC